MKNKQHSLKAKYYHLKQKIERAIKNGRFYRYTQRKQQQLLKRLTRYQKRLLRAGQLAIPVAGLVLTSTTLSEAQSYCDEVPNPFAGIDVGYGATPQLVDLDGDGDLDLISGDYYGTIQYYQNDGSSNYIQATGTANPFDGIDVGYYSSPQLVDVDGDGDLDLISGENNGTIQYYQNDGSGNYTQATDTPFNGIDVGNRSSPQLVDVDGDGDLDLISGENNGTIQYYQNDGSGNYIQVTGNANPFDGIDVGSYSSPQLVDVDGDGDLDLISGENSITILYYQNDGSGNYAQATGTANPFSNIDMGSLSSPQLVDVDGDGDLDLISGEFSGDIRYYQNQPSCLPASVDGYVECIDAFAGIDVGASSSPQLVDVDGDGDLDLISGEYNGTVQYYQNDGSSNYIQATGIANPFAGIDVGDFSSPQLVDVNGDGDLDLISGENNGTIQYYQNDGSSNYIQVTGIANPFDGIDVGDFSSPQLIDVDSDGDLDLISGENNGTIQYYQNDGSNNYSQATGTANPFDGIDVGRNSYPQLVDVDGDGDLDLISGETFGIILYYQNDGSGNYTQVTGTANPFDGINVARRSTPQLVDVDSNGDLDLVCGEISGIILYYTNTNLSVTASTAACTNNEGAVALTIASSDTEGPYTISNAFSGSLGMAGQLGEMKTVMTGITEPGTYVFEVSIEPFGCTLAAAVVDINDDCIFKTSIDDNMTYTGLQEAERCGVQIIRSTATVEAPSDVTYSATEKVILQAGFHAKSGSFFRARIGDCIITPVTDDPIESRTEVTLDDFIDEQSALSIFPIPASTYLYYKIEQMEGIEAIYLFDMFGRLVREERNLDGELDIADLPNGQYTLVLVGKGQWVHRLVQKQ